MVSGPGLRFKGTGFGSKGAGKALSVEVSNDKSGCRFRAWGLGLRIWVRDQGLGLIVRGAGLMRESGTSL